MIAARNELDLAAAWLLEHLLRKRGYRAAVYAPDALSSFAVDELPLRGVSVICLSLLSANSAAQLRYLVRRLRRRARRARIVIGYWDRRDDADFSVADATAATAADRVVTSLSDALAEIEAALTDEQRRHQREHAGRQRAEGAYRPLIAGLRRSRQAWCASFLSSVSSSAMKR